MGQEARLGAGIGTSGVLWAPCTTLDVARRPAEGSRDRQPGKPPQSEPPSPLSSRKRPGRTVYAQMHNEKEQEMTSTVSHSEDVQGAVQGEEFIDDDLDSQILGNVRPKPTPPSSRPPRWATVASKTHRTPVQQTLLGQLGPLCPSV